MEKADTYWGEVDSEALRYESMKELIEYLHDKMHRETAHCADFEICQWGRVKSRDLKKDCVWEFLGEYFEGDVCVDESIRETHGNLSPIIDEFVKNINRQFVSLGCEPVKGTEKRIRIYNEDELRWEEV